MSQGLSVGFIPFGADSLQSSTKARYLWPLDTSRTATTEEEFTELYIPSYLEITSLSVRVNDPSTSTNNITYTLQVNGVDSSLTVTAPANQANLIVQGSVKVDVGDLVRIKVEKAANTSPSIRYVHAFLGFTRRVAF